MSTFIGKYEAKADVKGRIFIPSAYRKLLPDGFKERLILHKDADNDCAILYPEPVWDAKVMQLKSKLDEWNPVDQMLLMQFVSEAEVLDVDSQGRVLISKKLLQSISVENAEVLFAGMIDKFSLWSKSGYERAQFSKQEFAELLKKRMMKSESET